MDAVATIAAHDGEAVRLRVFLYHVPNLSVAHPRLHCRNHNTNSEKCKSRTSAFSSKSLDFVKQTNF